MMMMLRMVRWLFCSVLLCSWLSFSFAQLTAPYLLSAVVVNEQITLTWNSTTCPTGYIVCVFKIYHDNALGSPVGSVQPDQSVYSFSFSSSGYTPGRHSFFVTIGALFPPNTPEVPSNTRVVIIGDGDPPSGGLIVGDPQFTGLRGQIYQVHGAPNEVFNIITDTDFQYNSRFVYLNQGVCPIVTAESITVDTPCFTHPGTYLGELALQTSAGDRLYIRAGAAQQGFDSVQLNDVPIEDDSLIDLIPLKGRQQPFVVRNSTHVVNVKMGNFWLEFTNSDHFVNQRVGMVDSSSTSSHGLLGQTWSGVIYNAQATIPWIEGSVWDYATADHELFSSEFLFNRFRSSEAEASEDQGEEGEEATISKLREALRRQRSRRHVHRADL